MHDIPIHWIQYDLVSKKSSIGVKNVGGSRKDFLEKEADESLGLSHAYFERGLLAFLLAGSLSESVDSRLGNLFTKAKTDDNKGAQNPKEE